MKSLYRKLISFFENIPSRMRRTKNYISEMVAIYKKRSMYKDIKWTKEQQQEFDIFWKTHYGKKISNKWHRQYEGISGVFDVRYIPEMLYTVKFTPKVNSYMKSRTFADKSMVEVLFGGEVKGLSIGYRVPDTYILNSGGIFYDGERCVIDPDAAAKIVENIGECVIKPTFGSNSGDGVRIADIKGGVERRRNQPVADLIKSYGKDFIIQEKIVPHESFAAVFGNSINSIRVMTYICNHRVFHCPLSFRIGVGDSEVDNIHAGGLCVGLHDDGSLKKYAYKLGWGDKSEKYESHPTSGLVFDEHVLFGVPDILKAAYKLHGRVPHINSVGWDFTIDADGNIVLIEVGFLGQSAWFPQMVNGQSLFGENTPEMLKLIRKKR